MRNMEGVSMLPLVARMKFKERTIAALADMICGNTDEGKEALFLYRSSSVITRFFRDCDTDYVHDGSTRNWWVSETLTASLEEPQAAVNTPPDTFARVIRTLMDVEDATAQDAGREKALAALNATLAREGFEAFYGDRRAMLSASRCHQHCRAAGPEPAPAILSCRAQETRRLESIP